MDGRARGRPAHLLEAISGNQRQSAAISGNQRQPAATSGNQRQPAATSGYQRLPAATSGYQRLPAATRGYQRLPEATRGNQKQSHLLVHVRAQRLEGGDKHVDAQVELTLLQQQRWVDVLLHQHLVRCAGRGGWVGVLSGERRESARWEAETEARGERGRRERAQRCREKGRRRGRRGGWRRGGKRGGRRIARSSLLAASSLPPRSHLGVGLEVVEVVADEDAAAAARVEGLHLQGSRRNRTESDGIRRPRLESRASRRRSRRPRSYGRSWDIM